jgi:hypothetical protein
MTLEDDDKLLNGKDDNQQDNKAEELVKWTDKGCI